MPGVKGKGTFFGKEEFDKVKEILKVGVSQGKTAKIVGRSATVVAQVAKSKDFEEYKKLNAIRNEQMKQSRLEKQTTTAPVSDFKVVDNDTKLINTLVRVATALERLADAWETPLERTAKESRLFGRK